MKTKLIILFLPLFFVSMQLYSQGICAQEFNNFKISDFSVQNRTNTDGAATQNEGGITKNAEEINEELRLQLSCDANSYSDEALVIFNNSDPGEGAVKFFSMYASAPQLWSVKNEQKYSISFMGNLDSTVIVPVSVKAGVTGTYTLTASQIESFGSNFEITLEDRVSGSFINLGITPEYTFQVSGPATIADRFYIHFMNLSSTPGKEITSVPDKDVTRDFNMYTTDGAIIIRSLQLQSGKITVFDLRGRKIASGRVEAGANTQIEMHGNTGVYIVRVLSVKGISNTKILVR